MARTWRTIAFMASAIGLVLAVGVIWETRQSRIVPYIVEVDKLGQAVPVKRADRMAKVGQNVLSAVIAHFLIQVREIVGDPVAEKQIVSEAHHFLLPGAAAARVVDQFLESRDIYHIGAKLSLTVRIRSIVWKSGRTCLVGWTETVWLPDGSTRPNGSYEAFVTVKLVPPVSSGTPGFSENPLGVYIDKISWARVR